jgi:hypothetical protein
VGPTAGLDTFQRKNLFPLPGIEPRSPVRLARSQTPRSALVKHQVGRLDLFRGPNGSASRATGWRPLFCTMYGLVRLFAVLAM